MTASLEDVFELQDQVTTSVVGAIAPKLEQAEIERAKRKPTENPDAYDCFLRGMAPSSSEQTRENIGSEPRLIPPRNRTRSEFCCRHTACWRAATKAAGYLVGSTMRAGTLWRASELRCASLAIGRTMQSPFLGRLSVSFRYVASTKRCRNGCPRDVLEPQSCAWLAKAADRCSLMCGEHEVAIEHFMRAVRLSPLDPDMNRVESSMAAAFICWASKTKRCYGTAARWGGGQYSARC